MMIRGFIVIREYKIAGAVVWYVHTYGVFPFRITNLLSPISLPLHTNLALGCARNENFSS